MRGYDVELRPGVVHSVEPGIYLPGEFGVRLEEIVHVTDDRLRALQRTAPRRSRHPNSSTELLGGGRTSAMSGLHHLTRAALAAAVAITVARLWRIVGLHLRGGTPATKQDDTHADRRPARGPAEPRPHPLQRRPGDTGDAHQRLRLAGGLQGRPMSTARRSVTPTPSCRRSPRAWRGTPTTRCSPSSCATA